MKTKLPIALSNKHIHVSQKDLEILFGEGYELTKMKDLSQPGQYACNEKVDVVGPKGTLKGVRILGPVRPDTQIEVSIADAFALGVQPIVRNSGELNETPGVKVIGPNGEVELEKGVIVAARHIHMHTLDGEEYGVKDKDIVSIKVPGPRGLIFDNVLVRVHPTYALEMHVDLEEGNASGVRNGDLVELIK
ncbi:phosphate propanoyltransferase [Gudongella oleilytica]|jgi:putative phosphotransacetylase|uniref:phosphate propanoyltransferase n=1 Tax=Gudongella oleilytica TaxID=1582259 RepID=UPI000ECC4051|nr:phosphate propanoyltransferase [Gudongella oleilytica]MDY0255655.1 phosphate propanoyltransferase [Gudongella oleilytica]HCO18166.1 propanediol utilization protein [Tissierellales bacterium]HMM69073.1 phosphate propanoyltransferase [Gudongella oleilytica]